MSISRKNWSALSSLARQWTMEDEEEVEREKRRRGKSSSADPEADSSPPRGTPTGDSTSSPDSTRETSQGLSSVEQLQLDFVEMLRVRDEKRRMRHVEILRQQKEEGEDATEASGGGARVELLGDLDEDQESVFPSATSKPQPPPPPKTASYSPTSSTSTSSPTTTTTNTSTNIPSRRVRWSQLSSSSSVEHENGESSDRDPDPKPSSNPAHKFVSSVSISLDKSPSASGSSTPMSPRSPAASLSPKEHWPSPCQSPSPQGDQSPVQNGHTQGTRVNDSPSNSNSEQTTKHQFVRQSSRTVSFRMMRKKEEESGSPLQRSASVRIATKKFESNTDQNEDEDKASFQRNSRQRISSRSIKEKMERLAQAAQKTETTRSPDVAHRTLALLEEVSRKRGIFEKEQQAASSSSPGVSRQEFRSLTSGMSDRINRWLNKTNQTGSSQSPADLRHVNISSKRSLFESSGEDNAPTTSSGKVYK